MWGVTLGLGFRPYWGQSPVEKKGNAPMNIGRAEYILRELRTTAFTDEEVEEAIDTVLDACTINCITKDDLLHAVKWLRNRLKKQRPVEI